MSALPSLGNSGTIYKRRLEKETQMSESKPFRHNIDVWYPRNLAISKKSLTKEKKTEEEEDQKRAHQSDEDANEYVEKLSDDLSPRGLEWWSANSFHSRQEYLGST